MRADPAARRYARALFDLADEQGIVSEVARALATIGEVLSDEAIGAVLLGPGARQRKREMLRELGERAEAPAMLQDFLMLVASRDRAGQLVSVQDAFQRLVDQSRGVTRATIRTPSELSDDGLQEIFRVFGELTGKQIMARVEIDPELIAGIIVEVEGRVYDGSLRTQLAKLHQQMAVGLK